jgi:maleate isomerase
MPFESLLAQLLADIGASRVTVRLDTPGQNFPAVAEATAEGIAPISADNSLDQRGAATARWLMERRSILVQNDCARADPPPPPELLRVYGVAAQMLAPLIDGAGTLRGWISVHETTGPRPWRPEELELLAQAVTSAVRELEALG